MSKVVHLKVGYTLNVSVSKSSRSIRCTSWRQLTSERRICSAHKSSFNLHQRSQRLTRHHGRGEFLDGSSCLNVHFNIHPKITRGTSLASLSAKGEYFSGHTCSLCSAPLSVCRLNVFSHAVGRLYGVIGAAYRLLLFL